MSFATAKQQFLDFVQDVQDVNLIGVLLHQILLQLQGGSTGNSGGGDTGNTTQTTEQHLSTQRLETSTAAIIGTAISAPSGAVRAKVTIYSDDPHATIVGRYWRDGTSPTESAGLPLYNADERDFNPTDLTSLRIRKQDAIATLRVVIDYWEAV